MSSATTQPRRDEAATTTVQAMDVGGEWWAAVDPDTTPEPSGDVLTIASYILRTLDDAGRVTITEGDTFDVAMSRDGALVEVHAGGTEYDVTAHPELRDDGEGDRIEVALYETEIQVAPAGTH